jgi:addiction module HigA family antidote
MARLKPIHPGEILREEFLRPLGISGNRLAIALRVPAPTVYDIINEERSISSEMAIRLSRAFGTTPNFWMNLQSGYDLRVALAAKEMKIQKEVQPLELQHT